MRVKMQQPAYKCEKMQMRAVFVNGPIPETNHHDTIHIKTVSTRATNECGHFAVYPPRTNNESYIWC